MYLKHYYGSLGQSTDKAKNILFYALCVLYTLTAALNIVDILGFFWPDLVRMDDHWLFNFVSISCTTDHHLPP